MEQVTVPYKDWGSLLFLADTAGFRPHRPIWHEMKRYEIEHVGIAESDFTWVSHWAYVRSFTSEEASEFARVLIRLDNDPEFAGQVAARKPKAAEVLSDEGQRTRMRQIATMGLEGPICFNPTSDRNTWLIGPCPPDLDATNA